MVAPDATVSRRQIWWADLNLGENSEFSSSPTTPATGSSAM